MINLIELTCKTCGNTFKVKKYRAKDGSAKYCSYKCHGNGRQLIPIADRFWPKIKKTSYCWNWLGATGNGYGRIANGTLNVPVLAHRVSWEIHNGPIPKGMLVLHHCDNRLCVRPDHLFLGNHANNMEDMAKKGRSTFGIKNPQAKLTDEKVLKIRILCLTMKDSEVATLFGIGRKHVNGIIHKRCWKHLWSSIIQA